MIFISFYNHNMGFTGTNIYRAGGVAKLLWCWHCFGAVVDSSLVSAASDFGCLERSEFRLKPQQQEGKFADTSL
jgi:hypothetical protein